MQGSVSGEVAACLENAPTEDCTTDQVRAWLFTNQNCVGVRLCRILQDKTARKLLTDAAGRTWGKVTDPKGKAQDLWAMMKQAVEVRKERMMAKLRKGMIALAVVLLIATAANIYVALGSREPSVVQARAFELIDEDGNRRALLGISPEGSVAIGFFDAGGKVRSTVGLLPDGRPMSAMLAADGKPVWGAP